MMLERPLRGCIIGLSISESEDLDSLGYENSDYQRAFISLAEGLLAAGARLAFGHDWRPGGIMEAVARLAVRHFGIQRQENGSFPDRASPILNYVISSVNPYLDRDSMTDQSAMWSAALKGVVFLVKQDFLSNSQVSEHFADSLTRMRIELAKASDLCVCLGGRLSGFKGNMPGVLEEAMQASLLGKPVIATSIFGGAAALVSASMLREDGFDSKFGEACSSIFKGSRRVVPEEIYLLRENLAASQSIDTSIELIIRSAVEEWRHLRRS